VLLLGANKCGSGRGEASREGARGFSPATAWESMLPPHRAPHATTTTTTTTTTKFKAP
jgi:hypothetical protein